MKVLAKVCNDSLATVYVAEFEPGQRVEFVESVQPPIPREKKWVFIISTLFGCPVRCAMCDAGGNYTGKCTAEQMLAQCDYLARSRYRDGHVKTARLKVQFARMGEPALNDGVLEALTALPGRYGADEVIPSVSTTAPAGRDSFFENLVAIKRDLFGRGRFQMQFSIHSTDESMRDRLMPVRKWDLGQIAEFGDMFYEPGDRKVALNFSVMEGVPIEVDVLRRYFHPGKFAVKMTPMNPTYMAKDNSLHPHVEPGSFDSRWNNLALSLRQSGFDVIESIGEMEENKIGSNCGQYVTRFLQRKSNLTQGYSYAVQEVAEYYPMPCGANAVD